MSTRLARVVLAVLCSMLTACGAASSRRAPSPRPTASYVAPANAICAQEVAQLDRLQRPASVGEAIAYLPRVLAIMRRETARLAPLDRGGPGAGELTSALTSTRRLAALLTSFMHRLRGGVVELGELAAVQRQSVAMQRKLDGSFRGAGLARCAE